MAEYVKGNDISAWQDTYDASKMKDAGSKYVYLRKSIGYYHDLKFWDFFDEAKSESMPVGIYHYFYAGYNVERQFQRMIEGIQPSDLTFPPVLDVEHHHNTTKSQAIGEVLKFLYLLKAWWTGKRMPLIYTAKYVWQDYYSIKPGWIHDWDLFVASYHNTAELPPYVPTGWEKTAGGLEVPKEDQFVAWQWQDDNVAGHEHGVGSWEIDMDRMQKWYYDTFVSDGGQEPGNGNDDEDETFILTLQVPDSRFEVNIEVLNE